MTSETLETPELNLLLCVNQESKVCGWVGVPPASCFCKLVKQWHASLSMVIHVYLPGERVESQSFILTMLSNTIFMQGAYTDT